MVTVAVMVAAYMWTHSESQLAWSEGQRLPGTVQHLSYEPGDLFVITTAPQTLSWVILLTLLAHETDYSLFSMRRV